MSSTITYPEGHLLLRNLNKSFPVITHGKGVFLYDRSGKEYLDGVSGAFVTCIGHGREEVAEAIAQQLSKVGYVNGTQFTNEAAENLAERLAGYSNKIGLDRIGFLSSGSEAVEAGIKFARQFAVQKGQEGRTKILARLPSYHGNTLFALSASGRPHYKRFFQPLLSQIITADAPSEYRCPVGDFESAGSDYYVQAIENALDEADPKTVFAMLIEPIGGSATGGQAPPQNYLSRISELCKKHGIALIADEVLTGVGRTGKFFACEHYDLQPDIAILGKGLNGGYTALSGLLVKESHLSTMKETNFMHAQTFLHVPCAAAAGLAVLDVLEKENVIEEGRKRGDSLLKKLQGLSKKEAVGFVTGKGLLAGIEFVADREKKTPFARSQKLTEKIVAAALDEGLTLWPNVGHVDGQDGDLVMLAPPLTITESEIDLLVERLEKAIDRGLAEL